MSEEKFDRQLRIWGEKGQKKIESTKILLIGAGGIGSEIMKNLMSLGFQDVMIIDMDKIEISNLNRQFFFDSNDQGQFKAETLAKKIKKMIPEGKYSYLNDKIQNIKLEIFQQFDYLLSALDNLEARIWLNERCVENKKIFIDGGAEGFMGHVQVIIPGKTPCLMCHNLWIPRTEKFKCNYAINPRTPEDCALEARDKFFLKFKKLPDLEIKEDLELLFEFADLHARRFGIIGVTTPLIINTLKNTVAQIITTNSIIGTMMSNELLKMILHDLNNLNLDFTINTFLQYNGLTGNLWAVPLQRNENCLVCSKKIFNIEVDPSMPLDQFVEFVENKLNLELIAPVIMSGTKIIYRFRDSTSITELERLESLKTRKMGELIQNRNILYFEDEETRLNFKIEVNLKARE